MSKRGPIFILSSSSESEEDYGNSESVDSNESASDRSKSPVRIASSSQASSQSIASQSQDSDGSQVIQLRRALASSSRAREVSTPPQSTRPRRNNGQCTQWCYTLNNPTNHELRELKRLRPGDHPDVVYHVFQIEAGEQGTKHVQGYIAFSKRKRLSTVKSLIGNRAHCETTRGTPTQASEYCKDPAKRHPNHSGFLFEKGDLPEPLQPGKRNDIIEIKRLIDGGQNPWLLARDEQYFVHIKMAYKFYELYYNKLQEDRKLAPQVIVLYGDTRTGKTASTRNLARTYYAPIGSSGSSWFNGYDPRHHDIIVFNEFHGSRASLSELLQWMDGTPLEVNTKGAYVKMNAKCLIFTSNDPPDLWYGFHDPDKTLAHPFEALERRLTHIWRYHAGEPKPNPNIPDSYAYCAREKGDASAHPMVQQNKYVQWEQTNIWMIPDMPAIADQVQPIYRFFD